MHETVFERVSGVWVCERAWKRYIRSGFTELTYVRGAVMSV